MNKVLIMLYKVVQLN